MAKSNLLITELSRRLRDPNNTRHTRANVRDVLTHCQRVLNRHTGSSLTTATFTPTNGRTLYKTTDVAADVARIDAIRQGGRNLHEVDWRSLKHADANWLRREGNSYQMFARIGNSLFVIYPALADAEDVEVVYTAVPSNLLDDGTDDVTVRDELIPPLLDMGEAVLAARVEKFDAVPDLVRRLREALEASSG